MNKSTSMTNNLKNFTDTHEYKMIRLTNCTFSYLLCGHGKQTLVFLDGGLGTSESWFKYIEFFENSYQILTFSFPNNLKTNSEQIVAIHELLKVLDIQNTIMIGVSYGALLAQLYTKRFPNRINGLILISGGSMTEITKKNLQQYRIPFRLSIIMAKIFPFKLVRKNIIKQSIKNMGTEHNFETSQKITEIMTAMYADLSKESLINMGYLLIDIFNSDICSKEDFKFLENKVQLIFPEKDFFPLASQESLLDLMANPKIIWIDSGSHGDPMFNEEYMAQVDCFLQDILI